MNARVSRLALGVLLLGAVLGSGCATPSRPAAMATVTYRAAQTHAGSVAIQVTGGEATNPMLASRISDEDFRAALEQAITTSGVFASVAGAQGTGDYLLEAYIARLDQPGFGFSMRVTLEVNYTLRRSNGEEVWKRAVESTYVAEVSDAIVGITRVRLANEGAARENIALLLPQLAALDLNTAAR